jgi:sigma-B regulation protein RsbU (phosphoserine phosphatase)
MDGRKVLIIEDDAAMRRALLDNFEFRGYAVQTASDGQAGLSAALNDRPDLVILDIMLPKVNGYEVCRAIRGEGCDVPIIMLTAKSEEPDVLLGLELGADDYVTKPFSIRELLARAGGLMQRRASTSARVLEYEARLRDFVRASREQERDLLRARDFQESLMGKPAPRPGLTIAAAHEFCSAMGGDFYDIVDLGPDQTGILLADASGHGAHAALVTGMLKVQVAASDCPHQPAEFVRRLNRALYPMLADTGQFLTMAYALVDGTSGKVRYANAGHNPMILLRRGSEALQFGSGMPPVGIVEDLPAADGEFQMDVGDSLWLYTDGLFEPAEAAGVATGRAWVTDLIRRNSRQDLPGWVQAVMAAARQGAVGSPVSDDMAVLAAQRTA